MSAKEVDLPWGKERMTLKLPAGWDLQGILEPSQEYTARDPVEEVERGLGSPINSMKLGDYARPGMRIAIVVDDGSRPTPVSAIFPPVLAELTRAGVELKQILIVPALGMHRKMEAQELFDRLGMDLSGQIQWENPDCDDPQTLARLGKTKRGTPVEINQGVAESDLVISIGCIEPHIIASYGGGYKNLFPGVAGRKTIAHNHSLNCTPTTFNMVGQPIENNPMRLDLEEAGRMLKPPVFIVNAVLNHRKELVRIVAGDPIMAHREGASYSAGIYGVKVDAPADVVITGSHPMDQDLRQGVKALANTIRAVKPGGVMLTLVKAEEGVGVFGLANRKLPFSKPVLKKIAPLLLKIVPRINLNRMAEEDKFFLYFALQAMRHASLYLYGPTIPALIQERLPFVDFVSSVEQGIELAARKVPGNARVLIFPYGGITYPEIKEEER